MGTALLFAALSPAATAGTSHKTETPSQLLKQGLAFYAGKTITLVSPVAAGQQYDIQLRAMAPEMASYLHATVNIEDFSTNLAGMDTFARSAANCLTIGALEVTTTLSYQITNLPGVNFNASRLDFLGGIENPQGLWMTTPQSNITSFGGLYTFAKAEPVKVMINLASSAMIPTRLFLIAFGIKNQLLTAYPSIGALGTGFLRGDGQLEQATTVAADPWIQGHEGTPIASYQTFAKSDPAYPLAGKVPTMAQLFKKYPPKNKTESAAYAAATAWNAAPVLSIAAPTATPADCTAALRASVKLAAKSSQVATAFDAIGAEPGYVDYTTQKQGLIKAEGLVPRIKALLGYPPA